MLDSVKAFFDDLIFASLVLVYEIVNHNVRFVRDVYTDLVGLSVIPIHIQWHDIVLWCGCEIIVVQLCVVISPDDVSDEGFVVRVSEQYILHVVSNNRIIVVCG